MNLKNKLILGCAQSDEKYGLSRNKKFLDTSPHYKNNNFIIKKFKDKNLKIISKLKFDYDLDKNYEIKIKDDINNVLKYNNTKKLYGILVHDPLLPLHSKKWKIVYRVLRQLKKKKIIKKIGISIYNTFDTLFPLRTLK